MQKNDLFTVTVEDLNNLGYGVAKVQGKTVFVGGAVDGDRAKIRMISVNKTYAVARTEQILVPSPYRQEGFCSAKGCGGCAFRHVTYEHEKVLKANYVRYAFIKAGLPKAKVFPVLSADKTMHYRNKAQYAVGKDKDGNPTAGFFAPKSHRLISAVHCPLQDDFFAPVLETLLEFMKRYDVPPYEEENQTGLVRHFYFRASRKEDVLLTIVINGNTIPHKKELQKVLQEKHPKVIGCLLNVQTENTNVICSEEYVPLFGQTFLEDTLCGVTLRIAPGSFYQVNHDAAELLYKKAAVLAGLTGNEFMLDLYCGVGSIGLSMAKKVRKLVGVEIVPEAVRCARENAARNGITHASFYCADAKDVPSLFEEATAGGKDIPDIVVLDPPRKGCDEALLSYLANTVNPAKILYISCNPDTLARDAKMLIDCGYGMSGVFPVDLFPRTGHVENVTLLTKTK
ncbi:MAG: 23S rRNA (uracil(1939)-C(5))-methyltransferase RlmD [Clostridia bacterium]|nr:23S rRNA (uracil(1939)-C(5))-methyltransferase RlmD [Clostridia bacterium]